MKVKIKILSNLFSLCATILVAPHVLAADVSWVGNTDANWNTPANWSSAAIPVDGDQLFFGAAGSSGALLTNDMTAGLAPAAITFNSGASAYTLTGNSITLGGNVTNSSASAQTIGFPIAITANRTLLTTVGGGNLTINGGVSGSGGALTLTGGGSVTLAGTNTYTGQTTLSTPNPGDFVGLILGGNNALPNTQLNVMGTTSTGTSYMDMAGYNQAIPYLNGNNAATGCYITNSSAALSTLTVNMGTANDYQFQYGGFYGNLKLVFTGNCVQGNNQASRYAFQMRAANDFSGGILIQGLAAAGTTVPLGVYNLGSAGGFAANVTNTSAVRYNSLSGVFGSGAITFDNGVLWDAAGVGNITNAFIVNSGGGILRIEHNNTYWAPITGSGFFALSSKNYTFTFSNDWSGFTGTLAVDTSSSVNSGVNTVNFCSNSPAGDLMFWGDGGRSGTVQWNGDSSQPVTLSFTKVNAGAAAGVAGGLTTVGKLSCGNASTLTYQLGDNTATTNLFGGIVQNGSGTVGVTKIGSDIQNLAGANTYTGPTYVGGGTLVLSGVNDGGGGCVVSNSATLDFGGTGSLTNTTASVNVLGGGTVLGGGATIGGLVTLSPGSAAINLQDSTLNSCTMAGGLTLDDGNVLAFDVGDSIAITGGSYTKNSGTVTVNVSGTGFSAGTYPLITGASIANTNGFVLGVMPSNPSFNYALVAVSGNLALDVTLAVVSPPAAFWKGGLDNNWSTVDSGSFNWADSSAGTTSTGAKPGVTTAVTFSAVGAANQATVLGGDFEIASLALTSTADVGIGGANTLQLDSGGLSVASGAGNLTISNSSIVLGGSQLWANSSANTVTVSAPISGLSAVTLGGGNYIWSGANTHAGTTVSGGGKLTLSGSGTLGGASATVTANGSTIDLGGTSQSVGSIGLVNGAVITNGIVTGTSYDLQSGTLSAVVGGSSGASAVKSTPDTVILSANNTFAGNLAVNDGTLQIGAGGQSGTLNPNSISNGAALVFDSSVIQTNSTIISGAGSLSVLGGASVRLLNVNSTFSGNVTVDGSALISGTGANTANATKGVLGNPSVQRTFLITNGATLALNGGNTFGGWASTRCGVDLVLGPGSQLTLNANDSNPVGDVDLNGAAIITGNGYSISNQCLTLLSNVVVEGTSPSYITAGGSDATRNGIHLGAYNSDAITDPLGGSIHFIVNSTGASADLTVSARLLDPSFNYTFGPAYLYASTHGGLYKDGSGNMVLTAANNIYSGPTIINAGKLVVNSAQGTNGMTNYVDVIDGNGGALGIMVNGTNQWSPSYAYLGVYGGNIDLEFTGLNNTNVSPFNPAAVSVAGTVTVNVKGSLSIGKYPLVGNSAAYIGQFSIGSLPYGAVASLVMDADGTTIDLDVTSGSKPYVWSGANDTNWDLTTANNWKTNGVAAIYEDLVPVQFDDTATRTNVNVVGTLTPGDMVVSNITKNYSFAGGVIGGSASLTKKGAGILMIANTNSYVGGTVVSTGTLQLGDGSSKNGFVPGDITDNGNVTFANPLAQTFAGALSGTGSMIKTAAGTLTLTASNSYAGGTTLAAGTVLLPGGAISPFGTGVLTISNGTTLIVQPNSTGSPVLLEHNVSVPAGVSALVDNSSNSYGNVWIGSDTAQWSGSGTVNFQNNGANLWTAVLWTGNPFTTFAGTINVGSTNSANGMFNGFGYNGSAGQFSSPTMVDASSVVWKLGDVGFTRTFAVDSCTLVKLGSISAINPATDLRGNSTAACTYEVGALNSSTVFAGFINDGGAYPLSLTKVGSGTLTLTGTNSYTGNTTVSAGMLELAQAFATLATNSTVTIASGAQLKLTAAGVTNRVASLVLNGVPVGNGLYNNANSSGYITGSGYLQVGASVAPTPEPIITSYNSSTRQLTLSWTQSGWTLESQTNNLSTGLKPGAWTPVTGASSPYVITLDPSQPTVFYRLSNP